MAHTPVAPPLPTGSVDFDKIHAAARQGHDLNAAIADATEGVEAPAPAAAGKPARKPRVRKPATKASPPTKPSEPPAPGAPDITDPAPSGE